MLASRRQFLRSASTGLSAMILGWPLLERASRGKDRDAKYSDGVPPYKVGKSDKDYLALFETRRAKENKPGLVIVIPEHPDNAQVARLALTPLFQGKENYPLFAQVVFVCLPAAKAKKVSDRLSKDLCVVPVDVHGKVGQPETIDLVKIRETFVPTCKELLLGKKNEKLDDIIAAQEKALGRDKTQALHKAIADLDSDEFERREKAGAVIREAAAPAVLYRARLRAKSVEQEQRLDEAIGVLTKCPGDKKDDTLIPFGVAWVDQDVPCFECSRSSANPNVQRFLQFVVGK